ncbi:hypothetical protein MMC31_002718 [Peltigera leucophlebia]|nr:hypothetical protein [Peltigera leucophlebia]
MSFAPPISRDGFHYNGDLYVEVGNLNRHKRASIAEISALLRPDLTKSKGKSIPSKDEVGHWYTAQLIHYGLPPTQDKSRAKIRLLEALNSSKLLVPPEIKILEDSLQKEYQAAERKAKAAYKKANTLSTEGNSKKRKQPEPPSTTVNVTLNLGGIPLGSFTPNQDSSTPSFKRAKKTAKKVKTVAAPASPAPKTKQTARKSTAADAAVAWPAFEGPPASPAPRTKQTARKSTGTAAPKQTARSARSAPAQLPVKKDPAIKRDPAMKREPGINSEPRAPIKKALPVKREPGIKPEPSMPIKKATAVKSEPGTKPAPKLGLINGYYEISCPYLASEFYDDPSSFHLILALETPRIWGAYDFGAFSGIIHLAQRPFFPSEEPIPLEWRGRETGEGEMSFGDACFGEIAFLGNGRIRGSLNNLYGERCDFEGAKVEEGGARRSAGSMRVEWDGYNDEAYEAERTGRWH